MVGDYMGFRVYGLGSKLLKGGYAGDYIEDFYRVFSGGNRSSHF